jgi:hypothetical protein
MAVGCSRTLVVMPQVNNAATVTETSSVLSRIRHARKSIRSNELARDFAPGEKSQTRAWGLPLIPTKRRLGLSWPNAGGFDRPSSHRRRMGKEVDENTFTTKLNELVQEISVLPTGPRAAIEALAVESKQRHEKLKATVTNLQDSIDHLRLSIKYILFDLEATRRENEYLRKMLEEEPEM